MVVPSHRCTFTFPKDEEEKEERKNERKKKERRKKERNINFRS